MKPRGIVRMGVTFLFLMVIQAASVINAASTGRNRRSLGELKDLIRCVTDRNPSDYINYGCWCGVGGSEDPVDQVDQCCQVHDRCYDNLLDSKTCKGLDVYATAYSLPYSRESGCPATMDETNCVVGNRCGRGLCGCDVQLARCLQGAPFHPQYYKYSRYVGCSFRTFFQSVENIF